MPLSALKAGEDLVCWHLSDLSDLSSRPGASRPVGPVVEESGHAGKE